MATQPTARRVLVVEDNRDSRETLLALVQIWGYSAEAAADGREGIQAGLRFRPQVAIIDIGLPVVDGYEVARTLREALGHRVRLIALTAYNQPEDRRRALAAGFDFYLAKPADLDEVAELLAQPLAESPGQRAAIHMGHGLGPVRAVLATSTR